MPPAVVNTNIGEGPLLHPARFFFVLDIDRLESEVFIGLIAQSDDRTSSVIDKALGRDMQITETSSQLQRKNACLLKVIEEICLLLAFPKAKYKDTQRDFEEER